MSAKSWSSRLALWAAVCALLLKAAVPMLASVSAQLQGKPVGEVCTVYGVVLPSADHAHHHHHAADGADTGHTDDHRSHTLGAHSGDHCALNALAALAAPEMPQLGVPAGERGDVLLPAEFFADVRDACSTWVARLKHGPPSLA